MHDRRAPLHRAPVWRWQVGGLVLFDSGSAKRLTAMIVILPALLLPLYFVCVPMPGASFHGPLPPMTATELELADGLRATVTKLAGDWPTRNVYDARTYQAAADYLVERFEQAGYTVETQTYEVLGEPCRNLIAALPGASRRRDIVVVGAHYDAVDGSPAANDNASGVAAVLAVAEHLRETKPAATLRFVCFANEEPPFFQTAQQGSLVYARACQARGDRIVAMLTPETIGWYDDQPHSQHYPAPLGALYPHTGDFLAVVGELHSRALVRRCVGTFRAQTAMPCEGLAGPGLVPGIEWSDHWSFRQCGYPAVMPTDTAAFRYPYYHTPDDTPDKLDYERCARAVLGIEAIVRDLVGLPATGA